MQGLQFLDPISGPVEAHRGPIFCNKASYWLYFRMPYYIWLSTTLNYYFWDLPFLLSKMTKWVNFKNSPNCSWSNRNQILGMYRSLRTQILFWTTKKRNTAIPRFVRPSICTNSICTNYFYWPKHSICTNVIRFVRVFSPFWAIF